MAVDSGKLQWEAGNGCGYGRQLWTLRDGRGPRRQPAPSPAKRHNLGKSRTGDAGAGLMETSVLCGRPES